METISTENLEEIKDNQKEYVKEKIFIEKTKIPLDINIRMEDKFIKNTTMKIEEFFIKIEWRYAFYNLSDRGKITYLTNLIGDEAERSCFLILQNNPNVTYDDLKNLMIEKFEENHNFDKLIKELTKLNFEYGNNLIEYFNTIITKINLAMPLCSIKMKKYFILNGLPDKLRRQSKIQLLNTHKVNEDDLFKVIKGVNDQINNEMG